MESTWESRDLPVLTHIVEFYDEHGHSPDPPYIADACGFDDNKIVQRALRALEHEEPPFITGLDRALTGQIIGIGERPLATHAGLSVRGRHLPR